MPMRALLSVVLLISPLTAVNGAEPLAQNYQVVLRVPSPLITAGPGLVRFSDRTILAVCPIDGYRKGGEKTSNAYYRLHVVLRRHGGLTCQESAPPLPYMTATPFLVDDVVYLLAHRRGRRDVLILKSVDQGATWSKPVELYRGSYWNAPTGIAVRDGVLYRALGTGGHGARIETVETISSSPAVSSI